MLKVTGCIIIFICCFGLGHLKAFSFRERCRELESILELIRLMELDITYRKEPLIKTFRRTSGLKPCWFGNVLQSCSHMLGNQNSLQESWTASIEQWREKCPLEKEDIVILNDFVLGLGKSNSEGQAKIIAPVSARLDANLKKAREREEKLGRMYKAIGTAAGIVIVILIV